MKEDKIINLKKKIKEKKDGLRFLKSVNIGIPYAKLTVDVTIRKELQVSLFHEITLKLLDNNWNNYEELRNLMGLDINYMDNILLELGRTDYINHYGQQISISEKGKMALKELKSVKIESDVIDNLYINLLDGSTFLEPLDMNFEKTIRSRVMLNELIDVNLDYLISIENVVRDLYGENQDRKDNYKKSYDLTTKDELYRIINIAKYNIFYYEESVDIYLSEDDNTLVYIFSTGNPKQDELYASAIRKQAINNLNSLNFMFDTKYYYDNKMQYGTNVISNKELESLFDIKDNLECQLKRNGKSNLDEIISNISKLYYSDRVMLYREYRDFIFELKDINVKELFIISNRFYDLTGDSNIISIIGILINKCKVNIGFINYPGNAFIKSIKEQFGSNKNLVLKELTDINCTSIYVCTDTDYSINIHYNPVNIDGSIILLEEIPVISFNKEKLDGELKSISEKFLV